MVVKQKRAIGGDFIDFFSDTDGSVGIVLADVSGHGIPAALITAMLKVYTLNLNTNINISQFLTMINNSLSQIIEGQFVAILLGILNSNESSFVFSNAGQCYPLLYKKEQDKIFKLIAEGSAIGVFQGIELKNPQKLILRKGDLLFLYTDGVTEGISQNAAEGEKILFSEIQRLKNEPLNIIVDNIFSSLKKETNNNSFLDDLSLIGVSVK